MRGCTGGSWAWSQRGSATVGTAAPTRGGPAFPRRGGLWCTASPGSRSPFPWCRRTHAASSPASRAWRSVPTVPWDPFGLQNGSGNGEDNPTNDSPDRSAAFATTSCLRPCRGAAVCRPGPRRDIPGRLLRGRRCRAGLVSPRLPTRCFVPAFSRGLAPGGFSPSGAGGLVDEAAVSTAAAEARHDPGPRTVVGDPGLPPRGSCGLRPAVWNPLVRHDGRAVGDRSRRQAGGGRDRVRPEACRGGRRRAPVRPAAHSGTAGRRRQPPAPQAADRERRLAPSAYAVPAAAPARTPAQAGAT
jgi:hypothetical protein